MEKELKVDEYGQPGASFLEATESELEIRFVKNGLYFPGDEEPRDIYECTLVCNGEAYIFRYGQSIANVGIVPDPEEILGCLETTDPGTFPDFCGDFGYDAYDNSSETTYKAVKEQALELNSMYSEYGLEMLRAVRG